MSLDRRRLALAASAALLLALLSRSPAALAHEDEALEHARELLKSHILIDGHNDLPWAIRESKEAPLDVEKYDLRAKTAGHTDIDRLRIGQVGGQFWSVYIPAEDGKDFARTQLQQIDVARRVIAKYPDVFAMAGTADEVEKAFKAGKIASMLGVEGGHAIESSLGLLRTYYDLGARYMTLTHGLNTDWADSATDTPKHGGLTKFGEEVVREMNRMGMLVDLSHVSPETMEDALRVSEAPVIFSHSSARAVCNHPRNVPDEILKQLPKNGGVVMITFVNAFLSQEFADKTTPLWNQYRKLTEGMTSDLERKKVWNQVFGGVELPKVTIGQVADHIEHVRQVAGVDHIGLGGDYDGNESWPEGMSDVTGYPRLFAELIRRGWNDVDLAKLAGGNVLRAMRQAEATARRLQATRPPSNATLAALDGPTAQP